MLLLPRSAHCDNQHARLWRRGRLCCRSYLRWPMRISGRRFDLHACLKQLCTSNFHPPVFLSNRFAKKSGNLPCESSSSQHAVVKLKRQTGPFIHWAIHVDGSLNRIWPAQADCVQQPSGMTKVSRHRLTPAISDSTRSPLLQNNRYHPGR